MHQAFPPVGASVDGFLPHGFCYLWNQPLLLTHLTTDVLIGGSYVVISFALASLVHRARRDIPFSVVFVAFGLFIIACGMTHFMEVWTLWQPVYWLSAGVKVVTAVASVATAVAMPFMVPRVHTTIREAKLSRERELTAARVAALEETNDLLRAQAAQLERQREDAQVLAEELEQRNEQLRRAISEAEKARLEAETASGAKSDFLAVMSHELRTPLNAVVGYAELIALGVSGPVTPDQRKQLDRIKASATHLVGIIDQILSFTRLDAGKEQVSVERVPIAEITREAAGLIAPLAAAKGLTLRVEVPDDDASFESDPGKVRQVLLNLLSNAVKFTDRGEICVSARLVPGHVQLEVRDTGIGIAGDRHDRVFDPFWQAEQTRTRRTEGTGLGLSVVRQLTTLLGGDVRVTSAPGTGSSFTVLLPASRVTLSGTVE